MKVAIVAQFSLVLVGKKINYFSLQNNQDTFYLKICFKMALFQYFLSAAEIKF
jgi:hypothetical protein